MQKSIIIFRFHRNLQVCLNRLELIKSYNPEIPVYGIYGGDSGELSDYKILMSRYLHDIYVIKNKTEEWKWKNFDLALREWYNDCGKYIDFDVAYTNEWDMLVFGSVKDIYTHLNSDEIGLTGLVPLSLIENQWYWTSDETAKSELHQLLTFVRKYYRYSSSPMGCFCPGLCFPKSFLTDYCKLYVPELCNDEIRLPLFAQILNYGIKDTGFFRDRFNPSEKAYFNCDNRLIDYQTICNESESNGRKVFHPFRDIFPLNLKS